MTEDGLRLEPLCRAHAEDLIDMAEEFRAEGDSRLDPVLADIDIYFDWVDRFAEDRDLPAQLVQQTEFLLYRDHDDRLLGAVRLRHRLNSILLCDGGNIGYEIRRSERGKGYGSRLLAATLERARGIGLSRVLLTAEGDNAASIRLIEAAGGVFDGTSISPGTGSLMRCYWITV